MRLPLLLALCSCVPAVELVVRDINAGIALLPTEFDYTITRGDDARSGSDSFTTAYGATLAATYSVAGTGSGHGLVFGAEASYRQYELTAGGGGMSGYGARAIAGYGIAIADRFQWLITPYVGYGLSTLDIPGDDQLNTLQGDGTTTEYGIRSGFHIGLTRRLSLIMGIDYGVANTAISAGEVAIDFDQAGLGAGITLAWRWDTVPALLD